MRTAALLAVLLLSACRPQQPEPKPVAAAGHEGHEGHQGHSAAPAPELRAPVMISPEQAAPLRLSVATVERRELSRSLRAVAAISLDETRTAHVHSRVRGWIEAIPVGFVGQQVKAGEVLCTIYSQEVYAAELELLATPEGPLKEAARRRLALWDVPRSEVARLESTREARHSFPLRAPRAGTVVAKTALQGMYVDAAAELYTLSDLSRVWLLADVYEAEVANVPAGITATVRIEGRREPITAVAAFLAPTLDETTRTRKVRFELDNSQRTLLPGAFASVEMTLPLGEGLVVPEDAAIHTGTRAVVFVAHGEPPQHFEPREVTLGGRVEGGYAVESGLEEGEKVATGAQFLLDSESRLRASSGGGGHVHSH